MTSKKGLILGFIFPLAAAFAAMPTRPIVATGTSMDTTAYTVVLHVSPIGDDSLNDGSAPDKAFRTIGKAFAVAKTSLASMIGVKVLIEPGRYHEPTIRMDGSAFDKPGTGALFVVEGTEAGKVIVSGSERAGWEPSTWTIVSGTTYSHPWPYAWTYGCEASQSTAPGCVGSHREMVVFNGSVMRQFVTPNPPAGGFYINETARTVTINLRATMQTTDLIEIPAQMFLFRVAAKNKVAVKKLIFEHENSYVNDAQDDGDGWGVAVGFRTEGNVRTSDLLIEDCVFRSCNSAALKLNNYNNVTIRRCIANNNGWKGMGASNGTNLLIEDCQVSYNAWRQMWSQGTGWDAAGIKIIPNINQVTIRRLYADSNTVASGVWFDFRNTNMILDNCTIIKHSFSPIYNECSAGPLLITGCTIKNSKYGMYSYGTTNTIIEDSRFEGVGSIISMTADSRSGCTSNGNFYLRRNYLAGRGLAYEGGDWANFFNTLDTDSNQYWYGAGSNGTGVFMNASEAGVNFSGWQALGKDVHSTWLTASVNVTQPRVAPRSDRPALRLNRVAGTVNFLCTEYGAQSAMSAADLRGRRLGASNTGILRMTAGTGVYFINVQSARGVLRARSVVVR